MKKVLLFVLSLLMFLSLLSCDLTPIKEDTTEETTTEEITTTKEAESTTQADQYTTFKIMSLNLWSQNGDKKDVAGSTEKADTTISVRGPKIADMIETEGIDIVGFQEAIPAWKTWIQKNLCGADDDYALLGGCTSDTKEGGYILYRKSMFTEIDSGYFWLAKGAPTTKTKVTNCTLDRIGTWAIFQINGTSKVFIMVDTHLHHLGGADADTVRAEQAQVIIDKIASLRAFCRSTYGIVDAPFALTGDMNSEPSSNVYKLYTDAGYKDSLKVSTGHKENQNLVSSPGLYYAATTNNYKTGSHRIDYVWVSSNLTVKNYYMIHTATNLCPYGAYLTDHNAIWAEVRLKIN